MLSSRPDGDLLPARARPATAAVVLLAVAVVAVLAVRFADTGPAGMSALDRALVRPRFPGRSALEALIWIGSPPVVITIAAVTVVGAFWQGQRRFAALALLGPGLTGLLTTVLKPVVGRTIADGELCYPSGHTGGAAALGLLVAFALIRIRRVGPAQAGLLLFAVSAVPAAIAGTGMVLLGAHYPTDVIGGYATAAACGLGSALLIDVLARRGRRS
ncbi:undecaprenyl-diphosphatase [Pseudonocardia thermophila]|mgnify:CR=1 FL=1|uniref:Undecaprenyl-diphosphatase n=1 Tax=Pseudonocardia thermophila TaxID=1848 RepID=A0A1M6YUI8_PSETH|nr:phosphatase PAP2 family protein [Pseudonocardia thermophila]SHL21877.1 undecaprenyl-diphosphatase [Pseudonocardia thermophila]